MSRMSSPTAPPFEPGLADAIAARERALDGIEERRQSRRASPPVCAALRSLAGVEIPASPADNISEDGLRLTVPVGFGVAVGQRYEVVLQREDPAGTHRDLIVDGHYATVVRTEILLRDRDHGHDRIGVGFRFDAPIVLQ